MADADLIGAQNALDIARRELSRMETLKKRGESSVSQVDAARAEWLAAEARVEMAQRDLLVSQIVEVRAVIQYRIALIRLFLAEGSLMARRGIVLNE